MDSVQLPGHWDQGAWGLAAGIASLLASLFAAWRASSAKTASEEASRDVAQHLATARISGLVAELDRAASLICESGSKTQLRVGCATWKEAAPRLRATMNRSQLDPTNKLAGDLSRRLTVVAGMVNDSLLALDAGRTASDARVQLTGEIRTFMDDARQLRAEIESEIPR